MADANQLNVATRDYIKKRAAMLMDNIFQEDPFLEKMKNSSQPFTGGTEITELFIGRGMKGGAYKQGGKFDTTERQTDNQLKFNVKSMYVGITLDKFEVQVLNKGAAAIYPIIKAKIDNAYMTMGAHMAMSLYLPGGSGSYTDLITGLPVICNDASTNSWTGSTYTTYGGLSRSSGWYATAIKGQVTNVNGAITFETLESTLMDATFGSVSPTLGATTPKFYSYAKNKFQTQQRFNDNSSPSIGFKGLDFQGVPLFPSRYCPGTAISAKAAGTVEGDFIIESTKNSGTPLTAYPSVSGEALYWINAREPYLNLYISDDEEFGLGFSGFKPAQDDDSLVGQIKLAWCLTSPGPRYHHEVHTITS
jgi:hypothetical protein